MYKRNSQSWTKHIDFILLDALTLQLVFIAAFSIRHRHQFVYETDEYRIFGIMMTIVDVLAAAMFNTMHNVLKRGFYKEIIYTIEQSFLVFASMILFLFSLKISDTYSRIVIYLTFGGHILFGYLLRLAWKRVVKRRGKIRQKTSMILVADEERIGEILDKASPGDDFEYKGLILTNRSAAGDVINGLDVVADLENAADYICREWVDEVFIYPSHMHDIEPSGQAAGDTATVASLIEQCRQMAIPIHIRLPFNNFDGKCFMEKVGGYTVLTRSTNYASPGALAIKRIIDISGGLIGSVIALLLMIVIGPMIKIASPGPVLFRQKRIGLNGRQFTVYKLRTMYTDAEERKAELMEQNRVKDGMMFKMDFDPRIIGNRITDDGKQVTGLGEFLRKSSLDEFPQFFNILKGDMSIVGTRPPTVDEWEKYKYHHRARLATKPGLTGMWQVSGRSEITNFEEVVRLDTEYINNWSIGLDIKIMFKTVKTVLGRKGAM